MCIRDRTNSAPVQKITIIPRTSGALGYTMQVDQDDKKLLTREELDVYKRQDVSDRRRRGR